MLTTDNESTIKLNIKTKSNFDDLKILNTPSKKTAYSFNTNIDSK